MSKNNNNNNKAAAKSTESAPAAEKKGTKNNPFTREEYSALDKTARMICKHDGESGAFWKNSTGEVRFQPNGEGIKGRTEGSVNGEGGNNNRKLMAARLLLTPADFSALVPAKVDDGTPGTPLHTANLAARKQKAEIGLSLVQAIMDKVQIELPESPAKEVVRPRNQTEMTALLAECNGDFGAFAARMAAQPTIKETIQATKGGKVTLAELANQGVSQVPGGVQTEVRRYINEALSGVFETLSA